MRSRDRTAKRPPSGPTMTAASAILRSPSLAVFSLGESRLFRRLAAKCHARARSTIISRPQLFCLQRVCTSMRFRLLIYAIASLLLLACHAPVRAIVSLFSDVREI
jgi:hypothetical protein